MPASVRMVAACLHTRAAETIPTTRTSRHRPGEPPDSSKEVKHRLGSIATGKTAIDVTAIDQSEKRGQPDLRFVL
jgi:hypothetical protein